MSLSLSLFGLYLINSITLSLSLIGWPKEGINALFIFRFSLFFFCLFEFFVFLNWAIVFILSVGVVLVSVCLLCWYDINCRLVYIVICESCEIF